jgi:uncharacterized protein (TIGR03382 family)
VLSSRTSASGTAALAVFLGLVAGRRRRRRY